MNSKTIICALAGWLWLAAIALGAPDEIPAWVENLRQGKLAGPSYETESANEWMETHLRRGEITKPEVFELLGDPAKQKVKVPKFGHDLDRPERDKIESLQYLLWFHDNVNWGALTVNFDADSGELIDFGVSSCICGYCPHVLAHDGDRWRLEGKMLAGCVGAENDGSDLLVLPRLAVADGIARVQLANWAPEIEELREPRLFTVSLRPGEALDTDIDGEPVVWSPLREVGSEHPDLTGGDVLVLEVKNTSAMERYLRGVFLDGEPDRLSTELTIDFGAAGSVGLDAVGTKFLRRMVVPIPPGATGVSYSGHQEFWFTRRAWLGRRENSDGRSAWSAPSGDIQESIRLHPRESAELSFPVKLEGRLSFALRLSGHYHFDRSALYRPERSP